MIADFPSPSPHFLRNNERQRTPAGGIQRLLAAAVVNQDFRELLLSDPERALSQGYQGETFHLEYLERNLVLSIRAKSLTDFALQLISSKENQPSMGSGDWTPVNQPALVMEAE